jgi:cyclic beta-1,2-glucan synthetase
VQLVADFAPLARERGDEARAQRWEMRAPDGGACTAGVGRQWFKRAFFDGRRPLGSHANAEARIDLIAQAWACCRGAHRALQRMAMAASRSIWSTTTAGLIKLLDPPLAHAEPSAGLHPGLPARRARERRPVLARGVWALMAQAELASSPTPDQLARGDLAYRYFTYLSPRTAASHPTRGPAYASNRM